MPLENRPDTEKFPEMPNMEFKDYMTPFTGAWLPSADPLLVGAENYQELTNMRYKKDGSGIEGINGYYDFNATALANYTTIDTGKHFRTNSNDDSFIIVHATDDSGNGQLRYSKSSPGCAEGTGAFESTVLHSDSVANISPRVALGPVGTIAYCNQYETQVWSGEEHNINALLTVKAATATSDPGYFVDVDSDDWSFPVDQTDNITNKQEDSYFAVSTAARAGFLVFSTRLLSSINIYLVNGQENTNAANTSNIQVECWNGSAFVAVSSLTDGTSKLAQSGALAFSPSLTTYKPYYYDDRYLYAYFVSVTATSGTSACQIYRVTAGSPMQEVNNFWDGIYRTCIQAQRYNAADTSYDDYTLHVNESSTVELPVGLYIGNLTSSDEILLMFEEQMAAIKFYMVGSLVNSNAASIATLSYWNGDAYVNVTPTDRTLDAAADSSFSKTGVVSWTPPSTEHKKSEFGVVGYSYRIKVNATLTATNEEDITIDIISGIPAKQPIKKYSFPAVYNGRLMLCGYIEGNEGNRIDYSTTNTAEIFNGYDSSQNGAQSIYVGSLENITAATQLYNRFGSNIYTVFVILKNNETWLLTGSSPVDFKLYPISSNLGCPAPYTLTTAEVGFSLGEQVERNVAMWISQQGPMMFDGAVLHPLPGIEIFFDPNKEGSVNVDYLSISQAWYDSTYQEWNILLPTGTSTTVNTWFVYNVRLKKWFKKDVGPYQKVLCGIQCISSTGEKVIYGGSDDGRLYELEVGASWNGNPIDYTIVTGDFFPSKNPWDVTLIRRLKFIVRRVTGEDSPINIYLKIDTDTGISTGFEFFDMLSENTYSGTDGYYFYNVNSIDSNSGDAGYLWSDGASSASATMSGDGTKRLVKYTTGMNYVVWSCAMKFTFNSSTSLKGFEPIMWGLQYQFVRKDV